ncbi:MAG: fumarylacetoacetase [Saprospiraceae bacterium]|nr:fumarylacetoacetase [Saprospiraceae bacterium]
MNDYSLKSWVEVPPENDFPIQNLPFGIFRLGDRGPAACSIIGDQIIDLVALHTEGLLPVPGVNRAVLEQSYLNDFISLGKDTANSVRAALTELLKEDAGSAVRTAVTQCLIPAQSVEMCLPVKVGDYTDFYSSKEHATNVGSMFRDPENALLPNWLHLPVGYHGRASSIVVSGTPVKRPNGQTLPQGSAQPQYGPSRLLDFELEMGFIVGKATRLGEQITTADAEDYIFGLVLFNDWSARDIQKWEYVPLGPFLGKSFASTMSPWIVMLEALDPFRTAGPVQTPEVLPYLQYEGKKNYDIRLEVDIQTATGAELTICRSNMKYLYWNMCQQLAHHTVNGCNMNVGDLCASGTISGPDPTSYGSMLELTWRGSRPIQMPDGSERKFINDGDTVILRGYAMRHGVRIGFGEAAGKVVA